MAHVMICRGMAAGLPCDGTDKFLASCDHEAHNGFGVVEWTDDPLRAKQFDDMADALEFLGRVPLNHPLRDDGMPNRPLTAFHMEIIPFPDAFNGTTKSGLAFTCESCAAKNDWRAVTSFDMLGICRCCGEKRRNGVVRMFG